MLLKCEAELSNEDVSLEFRLSIGTRSQEKAARRRVQHNVGRMATWGRPGAPALDFSAAVDQQSMTLQILLEVGADRR